MPAAAQAALRNRAVRAVLDGMTQAEAARVFRVHPNAVNRWIKRYREGGFQGLAEQHRGRRPGEPGPRQSRDSSPICPMTSRRGRVPRDRVGPSREPAASDTQIRAFGAECNLAGALACRGVGRSPLRSSTVRIVVADTRMPSFCSSPGYACKLSELRPGPGSSLGDRLTSDRRHPPFWVERGDEGVGQLVREPAVRIEVRVEDGHLHTDTAG
jgi:transposase-like protein